MASLSEKIAAAEAAKKAAEAAFTEADRLEEEQRARLERLEAETREAAKRLRAVLLARKLDEVQDALGTKVHLQAYDAEASCPGAGMFILCGPPKSVIDRWQATMAKQKLTDGERVKAGEDFAVECVSVWAPKPNAPSVEWLDLDNHEDASTQLRTVFGELGMLATTITNVGTGLAGLDLAAAKS